MNEQLNRVANLSALPDAVCRRLNHAREIADAGQIQAALDRFAVTLTAHLQEKNPLVIALLPDSAVMLGTLMQRTVFAQQVAFAEFSTSGLCQIGNWPSLNARTIEGLRSDLEWLRARTDKPFAINMTIGLTDPERLQQDVALCEEFEVPVWITSYGLSLIHI